MHTVKEDPAIKRERAKVENWLKKNNRFINITGFEKELELPKGLIQKWTKYDKKINDKYIIPIYNHIKKVTRFTLQN